uniref:Uncharacterized protein n=1 Tax=Guillardia theta TaxID=55529 RepID=A0A7S4UDH1_GUITH
MGYSVGKAAVRPIEGVTARDVTLFARFGAVSNSTNNLAVFEGPYILHYTNMGYKTTRQKFLRMASRKSNMDGRAFFQEALHFFGGKNETHARYMYNKIAVIKNFSFKKDERDNSKDYLRQILVRVVSPSLLIQRARKMLEGQVEEERGRTEVEGSEEGLTSDLCNLSCLPRSVPKRLRKNSTDVDVAGCLLPRCDMSDESGFGFWLSGGGAGGVCHGEIRCFARRDCCALVASSRGR